MKRLLVFGGRDWTDLAPIYREIKARNPDVVIEGEARGADKLGRKAAERLGIPVLPFHAEWEKYGRAAGAIRNRRMLDEGLPTEAIGFHENIMESKGSKNMAEQARARGIPTTIYTA